MNQEQCGNCHHQLHEVGHSLWTWCPKCGTLYDQLGHRRLPTDRWDATEPLLELRKAMGTQINHNEALRLAARVWTFLQDRGLIVAYHEHRREQELCAGRDR